VANLSLNEKVICVHCWLGIIDPGNPLIYKNVELELKETDPVRLFILAENKFKLAADEE
jgi:hypothetical protein